MNILSQIFTAAYRACDGNEFAQRTIVGIVEQYNNRMAEINHTEPVQALRQDGPPAKTSTEEGR